MSDACPGPGSSRAQGDTRPPTRAPSSRRSPDDTHLLGAAAAAAAAATAAAESLGSGVVAWRGWGAECRPTGARSARAGCGAPLSPPSAAAPRLGARRPAPPTAPPSAGVHTLPQRGPGRRPPSSSNRYHSLARPLLPRQSGAGGGERGSRERPVRGPRAPGQRLLPTSRRVGVLLQPPSAPTLAVLGVLISTELLLGAWGSTPGVLSGLL